MPKQTFIILFSLMLLLSRQASASCNWQDGLVGPTLYGATNSSLSVNSLGTSIGSRVADIAGVSGTPSWKTQCLGTESAGYTNQVGSSAPVFNAEKGPVYPISAIPGIGYSLSDTQLYSSPNYFRPYGTVSAPQGAYYFSADAKLRLDFWRTGTLTTGQYCLPAGTVLGNVRFDNLTVVRLVVSNGLCVNVIGPTCTVTTGSKNISVPLGSQNASQFNGIGSSSGSRRFNIDLVSCSNVKSVLLQFNATADSDYPNAAQQGVIQLQNVANKASGVGVQLLKGDGSTPMPLNSQQAVWQGSSTSSLSLPFAVRYLQTKGRVTPGEANAIAEFVVAYQ